jgi:hypothetical protein
MEVFGSDLILGDFRLSDHGLILASYEYTGVSEDNLGMTKETIEQYVGDKPTPIYLGEKYTDKLKPQITLVKNPCAYNGDDMFFSEKECHNIFRLLTCVKGYQWMKVINDSDKDEIWFKAKINDISVKRVRGMVSGIILQMECDSCYGYSTETVISLDFTANKSIKIYSNTDDLNNYIYPTFTIKPKSDCSVLQIKNVTDNFTTEISNVKANETITIDSKNEIITSSLSHSLLLNDFNLNWIRLLPDENEITVNVNARLTYTYRVPRKVVLL